MVVGQPVLPCLVVASVAANVVRLGFGNRRALVDERDGTQAGGAQ